MDAALVFTWTAPIPGREALGIEFAAEAMEFYEKKATDGRCTKMEFYFDPSAPIQFAMVQGDYDYLVQLIDTEEFQLLSNKGLLLLANYHHYLYRTGDRAAKVIERFGTVGSQVGVF